MVGVEQSTPLNQIVSLLLDQRPFPPAGLRRRHRPYQGHPPGQGPAGLLADPGRNLGPGPGPAPHLSSSPKARRSAISCATWWSARPPSPSSSTNTAAPPASSPWKTSSKRSSARSTTNTTAPSPAWPPRRTAPSWWTPASTSKLLLDHFDLPRPEGKFESVGGLLIHELGRVPQVNDQVQIGPLELTVVSADERRAKQVRARTLPPESEPATE